MSWDYRVVKVDGVYKMVEMFFNKSGEPWGFTEDPCIEGETLEELRDVLNEMYLATDPQDVLDEEDITGEPDFVVP